jgi:hypothetical protein
MHACMHDRQGRVCFEALSKLLCFQLSVLRRSENSVCFQALASKAADLGVELGLEAVNRYETNVINTAAQTMELLADVNHSNVLVHLDSYHMNIEENSMQEAVDVCGNSLGCAAACAAALVPYFVTRGKAKRKGKNPNSKLAIKLLPRTHKFTAPLRSPAFIPTSFKLSDMLGGQPLCFVHACL